jgi:HD-like signal output (HDOD) protein
MNIMDKVLEKIGSLPPFSHTALRLMQMTASEHCSLKEVAAIIESDVGLAANILKVANSAAFRRNNPVDTLPVAVSLIGERNILGIAVKFCSSGVYDTPLIGYASQSGALWDFSLCSAIAAREAAKISGRVEPSLAYTSGLLHDLGKIVISSFLQPELQQINELLDKDDTITFLEAEKQILGVNHCEIGALVAEHWKLPSKLQLAMRWHHEPKETPAEDRALVYCVHVGDIAAMLGGATDSIDSMRYGLDGDYDKYIRLGPGGLEQIIFTMQTEFRLLSESLKQQESDNE